jgi:beta-glucosidase
MSDCGAIEDQFTSKHTASSFADASAKSIIAGTDWCMGTACVMKDGVHDAITQGLLLEKQLDEALTRTLSVRMRLGMFDSTPASSSPFRSYGAEKIHTSEAHHAAEDAAAQGAVLLRNQHHTLPLAINVSSLHGVAVVGPHAITHRDLLGDFYGDAFCPGADQTPNKRAEDCVPTIGGSIADLLAVHRPDIQVHIAPGATMVGDPDPVAIAAAVAAARCAFSNRNLHSRMPLDLTPVRLKLVHACDQ